MANALTPFTIETPQAVLDDLLERLRRARLPDELAAAGWSYGADLGYMARLLRYWLVEYEWRPVEARLNRLSHFLARVADVRIHVIYERGKCPFRG